jgi:hypothetical protein
VIADQHMHLSACGVRTFLHSQNEIEGLALFVTPAYDVPELNNNQIPANPVVISVYRTSELKSTPCSTDICMNIANSHHTLFAQDHILPPASEEQCNEQP